MADRDINEARKDERRGRKTLLSTDSEGVRIGEAELKQLEGTSAVDAKGRILAVYHSTNADFSEFTKGDVGFHFGNRLQAQKRAEDKKYVNPKFIRAYLNIKNPAVSQRDPMSWRSNATAMNLWSVGVISDAEYAEIEKLYKPTDDEYNSPAAVRLREILESKGYDGIAYPNGFEGDGLSYIAFHNEQIIMTENDSDIVQEQQRTNTLTDREVLELAANEVNVDELTLGEAEALKIFKKRIDTLRNYQEKRAELGRLYKEQQFGEHVDRDKAYASYVLIGTAESSDNFYVVRSIVNRYSNELFSMDVLYSMNAKKGTAALDAPGASPPVTVPLSV